MKKKLFHYTLCGLDNIYLRDGFVIEEIDDYGPTVSIDDIDGLHKAIAMDIVTGPNPISAKEFRFIRKQLNQAQSGIAKIMGVDTQTVARWEKAQCNIPAPADKLLRVFYIGKTNGNKNIISLLDKLTELDELVNGKRVFAESKNGWKLAA